MDPNNNPYQVPDSSVSSKPKRSLGYFRALAWLLLLIAVGGGIYLWQHGQVTSTKKQLTATNSQLSQAKQTVEQLSSLPSNSEVGHTDCTKQDFSNTALAALTPAPIDNYQAYLEICLGDGETVPSLQGFTKTSTATVIVFKVESSGKKTFAFGTGTAEPLCFSEKAISKQVADDLSSATKLPICKTY